MCQYLLVLIFLVLPLYGKEKPTIAIITYKVELAKPWDPDSIKSGITGSEEAVIYMSQKLANLGYKVLVVGDVPRNSMHSGLMSNPRYINFADDDNTPVDIAISWRNPFNALELKKRAKFVYFWPHDTFGYTLKESQISNFTDVLWISHWQRSSWLSVNPGFTRYTNIFGNGINPEQFSPIQPRKNPYSCIYSSNYARGLDMLLELWPKVKQKYPKATLDIYYGWQHWGLLTKQKEEYMRTQVDVYELIDVKEHGLVSHDELNKAFQETSFWTYPCSAPETFCITALRAQMSGCIPVIIDGSALKETVRHGYVCNTPDVYLDTLLQAMQEAESITLEERSEMRDFILQEYTWDKIANSWDVLFKKALSQELKEG